MKKIYFYLVLVLSFNALKAEAQWLEVFYAFELIDEEGNIIDSTNDDYKMTPVKCNDSSEVLLGIEICENNKTWKFMEGYRDFDKVNKLQIDKLKNGVKTGSMLIEFPPSFNFGKANYYCNVYAGKIQFEEKVLKIILPETVNQWDKLKRLKLCPKSYDYGDFLDISKFQK